MIQVIESSEIISYIILNDNAGLRTTKVSFSKVRKYAKCLETQQADVRVECDSISIDAFRCMFKQVVTIRGNEIHISDVPALQKMVKNMPSEKVTSLLKRAML